MEEACYGGGGGGGQVLGIPCIDAPIVGAGSADSDGSARLYVQPSRLDCRVLPFERLAGQGQ